MKPGGLAYEVQVAVERLDELERMEGAEIGIPSEGLDPEVPGGTVAVVASPVSLREVVRLLERCGRALVEREEARERPIEELVGVVRCDVALGHAFTGWGFYDVEYPDEGVCGPWESRDGALDAAEEVYRYRRAGDLYLRGPWWRRRSRSRSREE